MALKELLSGPPSCARHPGRLSTRDRMSSMEGERGSRERARWGPARHRLDIHSRGMPLNLLVVQEDPGVASFIKRGLEAEGFAVRTTCDGGEGLRLSTSLA